ncbi:CML10, partial [Symbiodinium pilosum]
MVTCDAGAYGAETTKGEPVVKPHRWITNSDFLADNLSRRMTAEQKQYCVTIKGNETERSGAYCDGLVDAVLNGIYQEARRRNPARFTKKAYEVMFARPVPDAEAWRSLLDEVESRFTNSNKKPFTLPDNDPMLKAIKELVPWEITRAQAAWLPLARRLPQEFPHTHRGAALRLTSGDFQLEAEDLSSIKYPKQRYQNPVRVAVFFFGFPKTKAELPEQDPGVQEQPPPLPGDQAEAAPSQRQLRLAGFDTEIWFEDPPREVDRKLQYSLGRLHVNMGHVLQSDVVYLRMINGENTDPGGEFGGKVTTFHMRHGVLRETVPAEAHFRIGKIERRNALMRSLVERVVDERGLDQCLIAVLRTINSPGERPLQPPGLMRPEILRAEAMKALAEHTASSAIRRAVLRKAHHQQNLRDLQPGQAVAFWRWSGRFVSHDPDNKSVWLQVNTTTVKVANNQVRVACGWEEWTPSPEDIAILKDAERNLRDNLWEDQREEPPTALEDATAELAGQLPARPAPLPVRDQDYWRYVDNRFIRVHVVPRYELYIPVPGDCDFNVDDLADARQTHIHEHEEQPEEDQWRDPRCARSYNEAWTGTATFFRKQHPAEQPRALRMPTSSALQQPHDYLLNGKFTHEELEAVTDRGSSITRSSAIFTGSTYASRQTKITYTVTEDKSVPETPPFSAPAPGTPAQPDVPPLSATALDDGLSMVPVTSTQPASEGTARASTDAPPPQQEQQLPQLPQKRAADVLLSGIFELCVDDFGEAVLQRADETVDMPIPFHNETYYKAYLASKQRVNDLKKDGVNEDPTREDASSSEDESKTVSNNRTHTRQELKQLDRELPWKELTSQPRAQYEKYLESVRTEEDNWMRWGGIKPLSHKEADKILSDPKLSKRVLKSRAAYRDKNKGLGEVTAKCRVVLIGCNDPDIFKVT